MPFANGNSLPFALVLCVVEPILKILAFLNWMLLGIGALMALLYAVVCLMMWPYPQLVDNAGGGFDQVVMITLVLAIFTAIAGTATWLLQKRHPLWVPGEFVLAAALVGVLLFAWSIR